MQQRDALNERITNNFARKYFADQEEVRLVHTYRPRSRTFSPGSLI
jgi:hypothetical protein